MKLNLKLLGYAVEIPGQDESPWHQDMKLMYRPPVCDPMSYGYYWWQMIDRGIMYCWPMQVTLE